MCLAIAALSAALAVRAAATAAPPWSAPQSLPGSAGAAVLAPSLDYARGSSGLAGWSTSTAPFEAGVPQTGRTAGLRGATPAGATDDRGDAIAAWIQSRDTTRTGVALNDRLWISTRRAGGSFSTPTVLVGSGRIGEVDAAVGANGDILVAFTREPIANGRERRPRTVAVRYPRAGHRFGSIQTVGPNEGFGDIATAIAKNGRGYVASGTQDLGEEANQPFQVYGAVKPTGATRFRQGVQLDDGGGGLERPVGDVSIAVAPNADATVAWTALRPGEFGEPTGVLAAQRPLAASAFGAAETVTDQPPGANDSPPAIALDPATAQPVVAFTGAAGLFTSERTG